MLKDSLAIILLLLDPAACRLLPQDCETLDLVSSKYPCRFEVTEPNLLLPCDVRKLREILLSARQDMLTRQSDNILKDPSNSWNERFPT